MLRAIFVLLLANSSAFAFPVSVVQTPKAAPPFLVLPGFLNARTDYDKFVSVLEKRGVQTFVLPVERSDWFKVLWSGIFSKTFWDSVATPDLAFSWYLAMVRATVASVLTTTGANRVILVGHSAGGWLARAAMGSGIWDEQGTAAEDVIAGVVTLGSPHFPGPKDMTRGALTYVSAMFPGSFLADNGIFYVTVAGAAVKGDPTAPRGDRRRFAYISYEAVCGRGDLDGDSCVPLESAHLEGADQVTLPGVLHSMTDPGPWYGSDEVVDMWLPAVFAKLKPRRVATFDKVAAWLAYARGNGAVPGSARSRRT